MRLKRILCGLMLLTLMMTALPVAERSAQAAARYTIQVDTRNQIVTVYINGNTSDSGIVRQMICSTGKPATPTPSGTFTLPSKTYNTERTEWYYFPEYNCYAKWATRIYKGVLFHSVLYTSSKRGPTRASVNALGSKASHGCVRLRVEDAKWIAQNCPAGTRCKVYAAGATNADLRKRLLKKSFSRDNETYDHFMGREEGTTPEPPVKINLSRGSKGAQVTQLQDRLRGLGFYGGAADGKFGKSTKAAVCAFQAAVGEKKTGKVNNALWDRIFADSAPTSTLATLAEGWQGPAVKVLQQALTDLKLYAGAVDGAFKADTTVAVKLYQRNFNLPVTGTADTALQDAAIRKAAEVKARFGETAYELLTTSSEVRMARVTAKRYTRLRAKASKRGKNLAKLNRGVEMKVLGEEGAWTRVQYKDQTGYVETRYLSFFTGTEVVVEYAPAPTVTPFIPTPSPTPSATPDPLAVTVAEGLVLEETVSPEPTDEPTEEPTEEPTPEPTEEPTPEPTEEPTPEPTEEPTPEPTEEPTPEPTEEPTPEPTEEPTPEPTEEPTPEPTEEPTPEPTEEPTPEPTPAPRYAVTCVEGARLFAAPDAALEPMLALPEGLALEIAGIEGEWIAVNWNGETAWLPADEATLADELPAPPDDESEGAEEPGEETPAPTEEPEEASENGLIVEEEAGETDMNQTEGTP